MVSAFKELETEQIPSPLFSRRSLSTYYVPRPVWDPSPRASSATCLLGNIFRTGLQKPRRQVTCWGRETTPPLPLPCGSLFDLQSLLRRSRRERLGCLLEKGTSLADIPLA